MRLIGGNVPKGIESPIQGLMGTKITGFVRRRKNEESSERTSLPS